MSGEIVHVEFPAADADRAQQFWAGLFGWSFEAADMPGVDYRMTQIGARTGAAVFPSDDPPGHPNVYFGTDDVDASVEHVRRLGGDAGGKEAVPGHGWYAACADTEGNAFHLWQPDASAA
jgi:uncharacterized protein